MRSLLAAGLAVAVLAAGLPSAWAQFDHFSYELVSQQNNADGTYYWGDGLSFRLASWPCSSVSVSCAVTIRDGGLDVEHQEGSRRFSITVPTGASYGRHDVYVGIEAYRALEHTRVTVGLFERTFRIEVVPYDPSFTAYLYPVLADGETFSWQDRTAVLIDYHGGMQDGDVFPDRRVWGDMYLNTTSTLIRLAYGESPVGISDGTEVRRFKYPTVIEEHAVDGALLLQDADGSDDIDVEFVTSGRQVYYAYPNPANATAVREAVQIDVRGNVTNDFFDWSAQLANYTIPAVRLPQKTDVVVKVADSSPVTVETTPVLDLTDLGLSDAAKPAGIYVARMEEYLTDWLVQNVTSPADRRALADIIRPDVTPPPANGTEIHGPAVTISTAYRSGVAVVPWTLSADSISASAFVGGTDPEQHVMRSTPTMVLTTSSTPVWIYINDIHTGDDIYAEMVRDFNFANREAVGVDRRLDHSLDVLQTPGSLVAIVTAPWDIVSMSVDPPGAARVLACDAQTCSLEQTADDGDVTVTATNKYGGQAVGILRTDLTVLTDNGPERLARAWQAVVLMTTVGIIAVVLRRVFWAVYRVHA